MTIRPGPTPDGNALSPSVAFLIGTTLAPSTLLWATHEGARIGAGPDEVLIRAGLIGEDTFYRALARALGLRFQATIDAVPLAAGAGPDDLLRCITGGIVRLHGTSGPGAAGPVFGLAPFGTSLAHILALNLGGRSDLVVTTPTALLAGLRQASHRWIARQATGQGAGAENRASAAHGLSPGQFAVATLCAAILPFAATLDPQNTFVTLCLLAGPLFVVVISLRLVASAIHRRGGADRPVAAIPDDELPVYSVLVPLYREVRVLPRLMRALAMLDYPPAKLDVKIVVEADDRETRTVLARSPRPPFIDIVVVPPGYPRTKPRALNAALLEARGTLLTVYDAEDVPHPGQLRAAAARFADIEPDIVCLQAHLAIDNLADSWLSQCFALEYAALFDVINPGLLAADLPILLGGTSNHFRTAQLVEIGGWDAWNVTEDADLSFRIALAGYRTGELDSTTLEEAPASLGLWLRQRTRWLKGFMQTLAAHGRIGGRRAAAMRPGDSIVLFALTLGTVVSTLGYPFFLAAILGAFLDGSLTAPAVAPDSLLNVMVIGLFCSGLVSMLLPAALGAARRGTRLLWLVLPGLPLYYLLVSVAAWRAVYELAVAPYHWNKTDHGLARTSRYGPGRSDGTPGL